jgi:hypothetical protein
MEINLHLIITDPPAGVTWGLQKGSGGIYQTIQVQQSGSEDLHFKFGIELKNDKQKDAMPGFKGPFVQGPKGSNFFYIDIGTYAGISESVFGRRLKVPLYVITWALIDELSANPGSVLQARVPGKGKDGTPNCATVKPFSGWTVKLPANA